MKRWLWCDEMIMLLIKCVNPGYASPYRESAPAMAVPASPPPLTVPAWPSSARAADAPATPTAAWLDARDDVATALGPLPAGSQVTVAADTTRCTVTLVEPIALGHKFAVHGIAAGRRVRKYGECIGRTTRDVAAGAWVHVHNLATTATRTDADEHAWRLQAAPAGGVRVLPGATCREGTSPAFDAATGRLYWLDAGAPLLHALAFASGEVTTIALPQPGHVLILQDDGSLLLAAATAFLRVDPRSGACDTVGASALARGARWTGAACDADGRLWLAAAQLARADAAGTLTPWPADGSSSPAALPGMPTGLAATRDGDALLVVDAARGVVDRVAIDVPRGTLAAAQALADAGALPGDLCGAALDVDGGVWCALRDAGCVLRFADDGRLARVVRLPATRPTGVAFAGPGLCELVVTTATGAGGDVGGHLLALDVGVAGHPPRRAACTKEPS